MRVHCCTALNACSAGGRLYADFFEFLPPGGFVLTAAWFIISRNLGWGRTVAGDLDYRRDRLFHLPRLPAGIQERAALRPSRDVVGGDVAGNLDASPPSLVHDTVLDGGRLGRPR